MTSPEMLSIAVIGLSVFGSPRWLMTSCPPRTPTSARETSTSSAARTDVRCSGAAPAAKATPSSSAGVRRRSRTRFMNVLGELRRRKDCLLVEGVSQRVVEQKYRRQRNSREKHPPVRRHHIVALDGREHIAPARHRFGDAEAK